MTLLDRYLGKRILAALVKAVVSLVLLFILIDLLTRRRMMIVNHDVPWTVVVEYYVVFVPQVLYKYQVAALGMLVATLLVFGDAAQNNEITAALAGGISLRRLLRFPILIAVGLTLTVFAMQETVGVAGTREAERIEKRFFSRTRYEGATGISWPKLKNGWTVHILKFNRLALTGENVFLMAFREREIEQIHARRIYWDEIRRQWMLEDGYWMVFDTQNNWQRQSTLIRQEPAPIVESAEELFALEQSPDTKNAVQLLADIRQAAARGIPVARQRVDWQAKFSQPALCFVMLWLAVPFALRIRRGGVAIGFGISIAIALSYLMLFKLSMGLGYIERLSPVIAAWSTNAVFLAAGLVLFRKTAA